MTSVTGFTGFPHYSCGSSRSYSASDYADGLDKELTLMRPQVIAFDEEGNCKKVNICYGNYKTSREDNCTMMSEERAWSSPIYINYQ